METIRKKICFDRFVSHRNGISPYISKDTDDVSIKYITDVTSDSNYGSFPCDFVLNRSNYDYDSETDLYLRKDTEISRLRYFDVLRWYNNVNEIIGQGIFLKRIDYSYENITFEECTDVNEPLSNCGVVVSSTTETETVTSSLWLVDDSNVKSIFDCTLVDLLLFKKESNGVYSYNEQNTNKYKEITEQSVSGPDNLPEDDRKFVEKMDYYVIGSGDVDDISTYNGLIFSMGDNDVIFAIEQYDEYLKYEEHWNSWWEENCQLCDGYSGEKWESFVFDSGYTEPSGLTFVYDFEKYVLGKIRVPEFYNDEPIVGSKVPNCVFYLNYMDYLTWFNNNTEYLNANEDLQTEWEKRGGNTFKAFLESITPIFIEEPEIPEDKGYVYFGFASPNIELDSAFIDEFYNEYSYAVYEYSVGFDGELVDATVDYEKGGENKIESALTPTFVSYGNSGITAESKLDTLFKRDVYYIDEDVYGIFENFNSSGGQLFSCTFHTGESSTGKITTCYSGTIEYYAKTTENTWNLIKTIDVEETEVNVSRQEKYPLTTSSKVYQVVGIKDLGEQEPTITASNTTTATGYDDKGTLKIISSITRYNKTVKKNYSWWECYKETNPAIVCGDGEDADSGKYRNILLLSCVPDYCESTAGTYYYMVKYDNGYTNLNAIREINSTINPKVLKLPYSLGVTNVESYDGEFSGMTKYDKITSMTVSGDVLTVEYVLGATSGVNIDESGIHYVDTCTYYGNVFIDTVVDGFYNAQILFEKVEYPKETAYSEDFDAYRRYIPSVITGMEIGTQWTSGSSLRAYLYTDDSYDNLIEYPNVSVDISFNRGNAAAWEKHFKLSECNTFEDLQNYGNNYFNL